MTSIEYPLTIFADQAVQVKRSHLAVTNGSGDLLFPFAPGGMVGARNARIRHQVLSLLDGKRTARDVYVVLKEKGYRGCLEDILKVVQRLSWEKLLEVSAGKQANEEDRYHRQRLFMGSYAEDGRRFSADVEAQLAAAQVAVIGIGGIGSHALMSLMAMGVGKLVVVDGDRVALSNLNRQLFYQEEDVGKKKIDVLREKCQQYNRALQYRFLHQNLGSIKDFIAAIEDCDLVLMTADTPRDDIFTWSHEAATRTAAPVLYTQGVALNAISVGPLYIPGQTNCFHCFYPYTTLSYAPRQFQHINRAYQHGSCIPHVATAGQIMALETVKHLTGFQECRLYDHVIEINLDSYETHYQIGPAAGCLRCSPNRKKFISLG